MNIYKLEFFMYKKITQAIKNNIQAWHEPLEDVDNIYFYRIRFIPIWVQSSESAKSESAFIIEFSKKRDEYSDVYTEILSEKELDFSIEEHRQNLEKENENGIFFAKSFISNQTWYEFPVVWGTLDETFDNAEDYQKENGKYCETDYRNFKPKYEGGKRKQ